MMPLFNQLSRQLRRSLLRHFHTSVLVKNPFFPSLLWLGARLLPLSKRIGYWTYLEQLATLSTNVGLLGFIRWNQKRAKDQALSRWVIKYQL